MESSLAIKSNQILSIKNLNEQMQKHCRHCTYVDSVTDDVISDKRLCHVFAAADVSVVRQDLVILQYPYGATC